MSGQALWAFVIVLVLVAAGLGFFFGRARSGGMKERLREAEEALGRKDSEIAAYRREVDAHFDKTASLFVSMAGSYKDLFEHLSSGYEKLSEGSSRDLFRERVATLLIDAPRETVQAAADGESGGEAMPRDTAPASDEPAPSERSEEAEALLAGAHPEPASPAEMAEAEERETRQVDPVQADADAAEAMDEERREPAAHEAAEVSAESPPRRD